MSPIYEYLCTKCQEAFTLLVPRDAYKSKVPCPDCGTESEKIISTFGMYAIKGNNNASTGPRTTMTNKTRR